MDGQNFTIKAQEALQRSQEIANEKNHQQIDTLHLLLALLEDREGFTNTILRRLGKNVDLLKDQVLPFLINHFQ